MKLKYSNFVNLFLIILLIFLSHGCYTAFTHPPVNKTQFGDIYISDDCLECHETTPYSATVLPQSAQNDYNWQFYSGSAWWQDEETISINNAVDPASGTGPRSASYTPTTAAPVAMPVQGGTSLGKKSASDESSNQSQTTERKRSDGRRTNTTSSSNSEENSSSRSGRR